MPLAPRHVRAPETSTLSMRELRGRPVLVEFWDYTCINCLRTLPYTKAWHARYSPWGLAVIGVHTPEFEFARDPANLAWAAERFGLEYAVVPDPDGRVWRAFANRYWPAQYLVDRNGYIRYQHHGEGDYRETEAAIQELLRECAPDLELGPLMEPLRAIDRPGAFAMCERATPETHLSQRLRAPARLRFEYAAAEVNLVAAPEDGPAVLGILDNGLPVDHQSRGDDVREGPDGRTCTEIDRARLYSLVKRDRFLSRTLELSVSSGAVQLYAFSFGTCVVRP